MKDIFDVLAKVVVCPSGCWLYTGSDSGNGRGGGYAKMGLTVNGKVVWFYVHRFVYRLFKGPIPEGYQVDHICTRFAHDPMITRRCINPDHLEAVPPAVNQQRKRKYCQPGKDHGEEFKVFRDRCGPAASKRGGASASGAPGTSADGAGETGLQEPKPR